MKQKLSVVTIAQNCEFHLNQCLKSVSKLADEIIVVDTDSIDNTKQVAKKYKAKIYNYSSIDFGKKKAYGISKTTNKWILILDSDEIVSNNLQKEIKKLLENKPQHSAYRIPFQNHLFNRPLKYGGENYQKIILFNKNYIIFKPALIHEKAVIKNGGIGHLKNKIYHYSHNSLKQMFSKFTNYALREAQQKYEKREKSSFKKIFIYPIHMFWARFIKDKGYKDGYFRILLDLGFAYMEFISYLYLAYLNLTSIKS